MVNEVSVDDSRDRETQVSHYVYTSVFCEAGFVLSPISCGLSCQCFGNIAENE